MAIRVCGGNWISRLASRAALLGLLALTGCGTLQLYDGPRRPSDQVFTVEGEDLLTINGRKAQSILSNELLPGTCVVEAGASKITTAATRGGKMEMYEVSTPPFTIEFTGEAGGSYLIMRLPMQGDSGFQLKPVVHDRRTYREVPSVVR